VTARWLTALCRKEARHPARRGIIDVKDNPGGWCSGGAYDPEGDLQREWRGRDALLAHGVHRAQFDAALKAAFEACVAVELPAGGLPAASRAAMDDFLTRLRQGFGAWGR
jgi:hypothetical protein